MNRFIKSILFSRWAAFIHDLCWVPTVILLAYWIRFNLDSIPGIFWSSVISLILTAVPVQGIAFWIFGLYRGLWRYASLQDLVRVVKAVTLGTLVLIVVTALLFRMYRIPRSVLLLYPLLLTVGLIAPRILYRWFTEHKFKLRSEDGARTLIVGAGTTGEFFLRDLVHRGEYMPVALVDDDRSKHGREVHGIRVLGSIKDLSVLVDKLSIEILLIAIPSADHSLVNRIVEQVKEQDVQCRIVPATMQFVEDHFDVNQIRQITVEDLLGRDPVQLDYSAIGEYLRDKIVMVTGGGGSIGSELCRQICEMDPERLIIFDHGEYNLYEIDQILGSRFPELDIVPILGDVKKKKRVSWVFETFNVDVVFHAAAYKHVPMLEHNPAEGVQNNVSGTMVLADLADKFECERFVLISTDKAVNPTSVMGATKRVAELYCQNLDGKSKTKFITTRFGNVLGSTGSVVPLFERQIREGGPLTVTHKDIRRFFMTIPESVSLILQAGAMGAGGEIFVLDMGEPVLISDLAEQMIRLSGLIPEKDIKIIFTGLRPGEKLYEELFHDSEMLEPTGHSKLMLAGSRHYDWTWLNSELATLLSSAVDRDVIEVKKTLRVLVPEYIHDQE